MIPCASHTFTTKTSPTKILCLGGSSYISRIIALERSSGQYTMIVDDLHVLAGGLSTGESKRKMHTPLPC